MHGVLIKNRFYNAINTVLANILKYVNSIEKINKLCKIVKSDNE